MGYNEWRTAVFAGVGDNMVTISGSGILNMSCPFGANVTVNSGYIESTAGADVDLVNGYTLTMNGGYVKAQSADISSFTMSKGYLDIGDSDNRSVYCGSVTQVNNNNIVGTLDEICGTYCKGSFSIGANGSLSGGVYIDAPSGSSNPALCATDKGDTPITADGATIVTSGGKGFGIDNSKFGANNTIVAVNSGINFLNGSLTGTGSVLVAKDASVNVTGDSAVDGEAYVYSNCNAASSLNFTLGETANMTIRNATANAVTIDNGAINGSLTYVSDSGSLTISHDDSLDKDS